MAKGKVVKNVVLVMTYNGSTGEHTITVSRNPKFTCEIERESGLVANCTCISYKSRHGRFQIQKSAGLKPVMPEKFCKHQEMGIDAATEKLAARKRA